MRLLIIFLLLTPLVSTAQINRSAKEFASERIGEYITTKLFKDQPYKPISFGVLKSHQEKDLEIIWELEHKFEVSDIQYTGDKKTTVSKPCRFIFYLDRQMNVKRAESYAVEQAEDQSIGKN